MRITVLWEDCTGGETKGFGPHDLLVACVADRLGRERREVKGFVSSVPKKGAGNIIRELKTNLTKLNKVGKVFAVIDWDRVADLWKTASSLPNCMSSIRDRLAMDIPCGDYELVFLVQNMESLLDACDDPRHVKTKGRKPTPDERDRVLGRITWVASLSPRQGVLTRCPSFDRLVGKVADALAQQLDQNKHHS
jgi:hypothetical protein